MFRTSGFRAALITAAVAASALTVNIPARAGFSLEELAGFEVTHLRGVVNMVSPAQKVIEVVDPEGHKEIITVGIDLAPLGLQPRDGVDVSVLDGLVVDLRKSSRKALTFAREDVILSEQFGPVRQGAKVAMTSGTAEVVKVSENDHELSLRGPFGGVHNLDVHGDINGEPVKNLNVGDYVDFRAIRPIAIAIRKGS